MVQQASLEVVSIGGGPDVATPSVQLTVESGAAAGTGVTAVGMALDPETGDLQVVFIRICFLVHICLLVSFGSQYSLCRWQHAKAC